MNPVNPPPRTSRLFRVFNWLILIIGPLPTLVAVWSWVSRFVSGGGVTPSTGEKIVLVFANLVAIAFVVHLLFAARWAFRFRRQIFRRTLIGLTALMALAAIFYGEENWRGKRAWEKCKRELQSKGRSLDWNSYIPAPVPDEQNIFKAPKMAEWFVGRDATELTRRLNLGTLFNSATERRIVAELTLVPANAPMIPEGADLVLHYGYPVLAIASSTPSTNYATPDSVVPLVVMDSVPLGDAIQTFAKHANLKVDFDPLIANGWLCADGTPGLSAPVSLRWENVTLRQALVALLNDHSLKLVNNAASGSVTVTSKRPGESNIYLDAAARRTIENLIRKAIEQSTNGLSGPVIQSAHGFALLSGTPNAIRPVRLVARVVQAPTLEDVAGFFPELKWETSSYRSNPLRVEAVSSNSFHVLLGSAPAYAAAEYLAWSDPFEPDFDLIREALKRPYARMDGDYRSPATMPSPNFAIRMTAQTLASRAQCHLLLNRPDDALRDLALLHGLSRLLEPRPTGKPMTLVAAMINVAVTGLYVNTVADGFRLKAWRESHFVALQEQLKEVRLAPSVRDGLKAEQIAECRRIETTTAAEFRESVREFEQFGTHIDEYPQILLFTIAPRGWRYQNMATTARLKQLTIDCFDLERDLVQLRKTTESSNAIAKLREPSLYTFYAPTTVSDYSRAVQTCAYHQTMANEALIACALERFRLAHREYPETLASLTPQYLENLPGELIGGQPLKYAKSDDGSFKLYSVGWNETDDGGKAKPDPGQGDWVWRGEDGGQKKEVRRD